MPIRPFAASSPADAVWSNRWPIDRVRVARPTARRKRQCRTTGDSDECALCFAGRGTGARAGPAELGTDTAARAAPRQRAGRPSTTRPISPSSRRAPRSTSRSMCPASSSTSGDQTERSVDVRGFAGTAGNVVINGARPSTKAETLDILSRIPAQRVVRVELGPGDLYGSDYAGKSQVLNVVLSKPAGSMPTSPSARSAVHGYIRATFPASALIRRGASSHQPVGRDRAQQAIRGRHGYASPMP